METQAPLKKLLLRIGLRLLLIVAVALVLILLLPSLLDLFLPFVLAFLAATILAPLVQKLTKKMGKARSFWSMLFILLIILGATGLLIYAGYYLVSQLADFLGSWDSVQQSITDSLTRLSDFLDRHIRLTSTDTEEYLVGLVQKGLSYLADKISSWAPNVVSGVGNLASGIASFVVSLLFFIIGAYFMTADYPNLRKKLSNWIPDIIRPHMRHVKEAAGSATFGYLKAQLILSSAVTLIVFVALLIYGQSYAILIAIACGIIDIIPFLGSGIVLVPWAIIMLLFGDYTKALFLAVLSLSLFLFRKLAEPKVVGDQTGLSPLMSLISIYVGMKLGGVIGMILCPILCMVLIGLYGMGFFDPTIADFKMLFYRIISAAKVPQKETADPDAPEEASADQSQEKDSTSAEKLS